MKLEIQILHTNLCATTPIYLVNIKTHFFQHSGQVTVSWWADPFPRKHNLAQLEKNRTLQSIMTLFTSNHNVSHDHRPQTELENYLLPLQLILD